MDPSSRAAALEKLMRQRERGVATEAPPEPSLMDRLRMLISGQGTQWADNANAMLPESVSGREAVEAQRRKAQMLEQIAKGGQ